jgi:hypothetical protein
LREGRREKREEGREEREERREKTFTYYLLPFASYLNSHGRASILN